MPQMRPKRTQFFLKNNLSTDITDCGVKILKAALVSSKEITVNGTPSPLLNEHILNSVIKERTCLERAFSTIFEHVI